MARARVSVGGTTRVTVGGVRETKTAVGIQGPPGVSQNSLGDLSDIDITSLPDGAVLVWSQTAQKWVANTTLSNVNVDGGSF